MGESWIRISRSPVLTLWCAVVAERCGYVRDTALTLGKVLAGIISSQASWSLSARGGGGGDAAGQGGDQQIELLGHSLPAVRTAAGVRALSGGAPVDAARVQDYLVRSFGARLDDVRSAMHDLASSYTPRELEERALALYKAFRPNVVRGQPELSEMNVDKIRELRKAGKGRA